MTVSVLFSGICILETSLVLISWMILFFIQLQKYCKDMKSYTHILSNIDTILSIGLYLSENVFLNRGFSLIAKNSLIIINEFFIDCQQGKC